MRACLQRPTGYACYLQRYASATHLERRCTYQVVREGPYGDVCTRDTGRILTRARAFPQIVGSREEEEGKGRAKEGVKGSIRPGTSADGGDGRSYSLHGGA